MTRDSERHEAEVSHWQNSDNREVILGLLQADDYWGALCSIKSIDEMLAGAEQDGLVGEGPKSAVATALLDLLNDFHEERWDEIWDDYETALASGASDSIEDITVSGGDGDA